jgi:hypothetical protein
MAVLLKVAQGATGFWPFQIMAQNNAGPLKNRYLPTDPFSSIIWPASARPDSALAVTPTGLWIDATAGTWSYNLTSAQTLAIPEGLYRTSVKVNHAGNTEDIFETDLSIAASGHLYGPPAGSAVIGPTSAALGLVTPLFCTDEDIAGQCVPDYVSLLPVSQLLARGSDGQFLASDPWTLISPSNNFTTQLQPVWSQQATDIPSQVGYVIWLSRPQSTFHPPGVFMGVSQGTGTSLTLRRLGMPSGWGAAPVPASGLTGVEFQVCTFYPQIEKVSYDLNQHYQINTAGSRGKQAANMRDMRVLQNAAVTRVLLDRYSDETRTRTGDYSYKIDILGNQLSALESELTVRWLPNVGMEMQTNQFSTRIVR